MNTAEELLESLKRSGDVIQSIVRNFKKDSAERKTNATYYEERLRRLAEAWDLFEAQDTKLRTLAVAPRLRTEHEYFTDDYYAKINELTTTYMETFSAEMSRLKKLEKPVRELVEDEPSTLQKQQFSQHGEKLNDHQGPIRSIRARMTALKRLLAGISQTEEIQPRQYYDIKSNTINKLWDQIQVIYYEICQQWEEPTKYGFEVDEYHDLEDVVQQHLINLSIMASKHQTNTVTPSSAASRSDIQSAIQLPKVTIPHFNGDYLKWRQFHDLFSQMVDKQPIPSIQKMWYLKSNVSGEAEHLIRQFTLTEENYNTAWQTLQDRYNNKRIFVSNLVDKILNQSACTSSAIAIKSLHDTTKECLLALNNLGVETSSWDAILLQLLLKKVDKNIHIRFVQSLKSPKEIPTISEFLSYLEMQFQALEATCQKDRPTNKVTSSVVSFIRSNNSCQLCNGRDHKLYHCNKFLQLSEPMRLQWVQKQKLCVNCFKPDHSSKSCSSRCCKKCTKKHNTLLHLEKGPHIVQQNFKNNSGPETKRVNPESYIQPSSHSTDTVAVTSATLNTAGRRQGYVLLATAKVVVTAPNGASDQFKAVLDSGSQVNLVSRRLTQRLFISPTEASLCIDGVGKTQKRSNYRVNINMMSRDHSFSTDLEAYVLPSIIPPQPSARIDISTWEIPGNITLADPLFNKQEKVDILLGAEFCYKLTQDGTIRLHDNLPILQNTALGWVVGGAITKDPFYDPSTSTCAVFSRGTSLEETIERLWKLDEIEAGEKPLSPSDKECELHFNQHTRINQEGRFVVRIPFRENSEALGDSYSTAFNRFLGLERKLQKNEVIRTQYIDFMQQYEQLRHMQRIDIGNLVGPKYFIPHHSVLKPESSSTKLRVVFDASAKTSSGYSLNDLMYTGPTVQSELFSILLRFRIPKFVFTTDIEKMYRQILIHPDDHQYQIIMWREKPSEPINYYKLNTVTYGTRAAPYMATKCLQRIADENMVNYPYGSQMLKQNFYVDDGLGGSDSLNIAIATQQELITILKHHGFTLKKWCANHPQLLKNIPLGDQEVNLNFNSNEASTIKTLGLLWLPKTDELCVKVKLDNIKIASKRTATSDLAKLFDPLGLLAPVVVRAKIFIQQLWQLKLDWDQPLPENLHNMWSAFRNDLNNLNNMKISRHVFKGEIPSKFQLHIFADASEKAFGAVAYLRAKLKNGQTIVQLLCAKTRVAPLKQQTLPRLELCAAVIAAQLSSRIRADLHIKNQTIFFWTDSEIVLSWINTQSTLYQTFVANRVATIQSLTIADQWRHVASKDNPADILSRGVPASKLHSCNLWFYGPLFLHGREQMWPPKFSRQLQICSDSERKKPTTVAINTVSSDEFIYKIEHKNSFGRLQRVIGYILRFIEHSKIKTAGRATHQALSPGELDKSLFVVIRAIQRSDFSTEIEQLGKNKEINKKSSIISLTPFLDQENILRVGGRLEASTLSYERKHPMLIPYNDPLVKLLFTMIHEENNHWGAQALLNIIRQRFWPIKGKIMARSTVQKCIRCTKARPQLCQQLMGNLPPNRVTPARPFVNAGVDYCGPFWVHHRVRGKRPTKAYIAVFCCFATKAVHLELVSDLTTEAFIGALKRFISRRGRCQNIYSDNATNFLGAKNQLSELADSIYSNKGQELIITAASSRGIQFHFIPPRAPHFGGLWEAAVKSAKYMLLRSVAMAALTQEELETTVIEIEAILNSRPLTPMSNDPNNLEALTPGHFLIGEPLISQIDSRAVPINASRLSHWKLVAHLKQQFWKRWSSEYLNQLQQRHKWNKQSPNLKIGDMVIVKEDNLPVMRWPLARVVKIHPGDDGIVRVVEVRTANGEFKRPIHRIALLPIEQNPEANECVDESDKQTVNVALVSSEEPKPKRPKMLATHLNLALLIIMFFLPLISGSPVENKKFGTKLGMHFENIGTAAVSTSEWNLFVYYDLNAYWSETATLINGTKSLKNLCQIMIHNKTCLGIIQHFEHIENDLQLENRLLRSKRGALNIVGNVANSLFGVLNSEYADRMSETIQQFKENDSYLLALLKNQTSIIDSTINIIRQNQIAARARFERLEETIKSYSENLQHINQVIAQIQLNQLFNSAVLELTLLANNIRNIQDSILDTLIDTHHGKISPFLLSPDQLQEAINQIKLHLPSSLNLPIMGKDQLLQLFRLMKVKGRLTHRHAIFKITLPLTTHEQFTMFYLTPVPNTINNTLLVIKPCTNLLGISTSRSQYIVLSSSEFGSCDTIHTNSFLCHNVQIRYNYGSERCACEISLFNNKTIPKCNIERTDSKWIPLNTKNQWIYATSSSSHATAVCHREIIRISLKGSGLLTLDPECTLKHELVTINGHQAISSTVKYAYTGLGNISDLSSQPNTTDFMNSNQSSLNKLQNNYTKNIDELTALQKALKEQNIMDLPNKLKSHQQHSHAIGYISLLLGLVTITVVLLNFCKNRRRIRTTTSSKETEENIELPNINTTPTPMPRHQVHGFVVDV